MTDDGPSWTPPPDCDHCTRGAVDACCHSIKFGIPRFWHGSLACGCAAGLRLSTQGRHIPFAVFEADIRENHRALTPRNLAEDMERGTDSKWRWRTAPQGRLVQGWVYYRVTSAEAPRLELWEQMGTEAAKAFRGIPSAFTGGRPNLDGSAFAGGRNHTGGQA